MDLRNRADADSGAELLVDVDLRLVLQFDGLSRAAFVGWK
jgi:hypothetical protein